MRTLFLSLVLLLCLSFSKAQSFHFTLFAGMSNYQGDLQPKNFTFNQANAAFGVGGLYEITEQLYIRGNITVGKISCADSKSILNAYRNLSFSSQIYDAHLGLEYDILNSYEKSLVPYIFAGISVFNFNPYTFDTTGRKIFLQPLGTEGQGFYQGRSKYNLTQIALPFGAGLKLSLSENIRVRFEVGLRKTFTDYLDDVSTTYVDPNLLLLNNGQRAVELAYRSDEVKGGGLTYPTNAKRGNPTSKDFYYFTGLGLSFRIPPIFNTESHRSGASRTSCPVNVF